MKEVSIVWGEPILASRLRTNIKGWERLPRGSNSGIESWYGKEKEEEFFSAERITCAKAWSWETTCYFQETGTLFCKIWKTTERSLSLQMAWPNFPVKKLSLKLSLKNVRTAWTQ